MYCILLEAVVVVVVEFWPMSATGRTGGPGGGGGTNTGLNNPNFELHLAAGVLALD